MRLLRDAIIAQAVDDYKALVAGTLKPCMHCNIEEIERFFKSEYCETLLCDVELTGEYILRWLRQWRKEYLAALKNGTATEDILKKSYRTLTAERG